MSRLSSKSTNAARRLNRTRVVIKKHSSRPRLSVFVSNKNIFAQIIDDNSGTTLVSASSLSNKEANMTESAAKVGVDIAKKAKSKKINEVAFDRGSKLYHGRIKAFADSAREEGLKF